MRRRHSTVLLTVLLLAASRAGWSVVVPGGGSRRSDCLAVFDAPGANSPAPPRPARRVDCTDGDPTCDADGLRNARCTFTLRLCVNSTAVDGCTPDRTDSLTIDHAIDDGDPKFDTDFQALQARADTLHFPDVESQNRCTLASSISIALVPPRNGSGPWKKAKKKLRLSATGFTDRDTSDRDTMKFTCKPAGDGLYGPRDLYTSTFDRIRQQVFATSCALSGCHDSNTHEHDLILLPNAAYSQIVGVDPVTAAALADGLKRIDPGNPQNSLLFLKIDAKTHGTTLPDGYGSGMPFIGSPVADNLVEIVRLWILGDATTGPAPDDCPDQACWVQGTDQ